MTIAKALNFEMFSRETLPLGVETANLLAAGETPSNAGATLTRTDVFPNVPAPASLSGSPQVAGTVVTQTLTNLTANAEYRLDLVFQAAPGKVWEVPVIVTVPI